MADQPDTPPTSAEPTRTAISAPQTGGASPSPEGPSVAIALHSSNGRAQTTQVVAKGTGDIAEQILQLAFDHGVKVRTDADLAAILSAVEVESEIPLEALTSVANILSYIYRAEQPLPPESST